MAKKSIALESIIERDRTLDGEKKMLFQSYALLFSEDFIKNLDLTSIELDEKYGTEDPSSWMAFLSHTPIKRVIDEFLNERAEKQAMKQLSESNKASDALRIKEMVDSKKNTEDNSKLVVVFLPQKYYKADI